MASGRITVTVVDHTDEVLRAVDEQIELALKAVGVEAMTYAIEECPVDTSRLRNSITWATEHETGGGDSTTKQRPESGAVYLGTNVEYGVYVEYGTGKFADNGQGRQTPWVYMDKQGNWHRTSGMKPHHFLRDAFSKHQKRFLNIIKAALNS